MTDLNISNSINEYVVEITELTEKISDLPTSYDNYKKESIIKKLFNPKSVEDLLDSKIVQDFSCLFKKEMESIYNQLEKKYLNEYVKAKQGCCEHLYDLTLALAMQTLKKKDKKLYEFVDISHSSRTEKEKLKDKKNFLEFSLKELCSCTINFNYFIHQGINPYRKSFPVLLKGLQWNEIYYNYFDDFICDEIKIYKGQWEDVEDKNEKNRLIYETIQNYRSSIQNYDSYINAVSQSLKIFKDMYISVLNMCDHVYYYRDSLYHKKISSDLNIVLKDISSSLFDTHDLIEEMKTCKEQLLCLATTAREISN